MTDLHGFFAALPTPFTADSSNIAERSLGDLVRRNLDAGLDGLYVGGSTGEAFLMTEKERERVLRIALEAASGPGRMIAHVGDPDPTVSGRLARVAAKMGYDAISAVPPFYYQYGIEEIREHYSLLARQTDLPFIIYNFPMLSGVRWSVDELAGLLELPGVIGVKNTCADLYAFEKLRRRSPESILYHGFDETLLPGLSVGADGGIGSTYNIQAARILALADAHRRGLTKEAQDLQAQANNLIDVLVSVGVLPGLKYLLDQSGIPMGNCRRPFRPLSDSSRQKLDAVAEHNFGSGQMIRADLNSTGV